MLIQYVKDDWISEMQKRVQRKVNHRMGNTLEKLYQRLSLTNEPISVKGYRMHG